MVGTHWALLGQAQDGVSSQWKMLPGREGRGARESGTPAKMSVAHRRVGLMSCPGSLHAQCAGIGHRGSAGPSRHSQSINCPTRISWKDAGPSPFFSVHSFRKQFFSAKPLPGTSIPQRGRGSQAKQRLPSSLSFSSRGSPFPSSRGAGAEETAAPPFGSGGELPSLKFFHYHWTCSALQGPSLRSTGTTSKAGQTLGASQKLTVSGRGSRRRQELGWDVSRDGEEGPAGKGLGGCLWLQREG